MNSVRSQQHTGTAFMNGEYIPLSEAKISVLDFGLVRSDATYDVVHVWRGRFFRLDDHLDRFFASMRALRLDPGYSRDDVAEILRQCVRRSGLEDAFVSMTCTRGRPAPGIRDLRLATPTFYCYAMPFLWILNPEQQETGGRMWLSSIPRISEQSVDATVKNYHWLDIDRAQMEAYDNGAEMVVLQDGEGCITEGAGYNIFARVGDTWITPDRNVLMGITRRTTIEIIRDLSSDMNEGELRADDLRRASEIFITSTAGGIMPIVELDGQPVGDGGPGELTRQVRDEYWRRHEDDRWSVPV